MMSAVTTVAGGGVCWAMADSKRSGWSFAAGVMVGGAVALWVSFAWLLPAMGPAMVPLSAEQPPPAASAVLASIDTISSFMDSSTCVGEARMHQPMERAASGPAPGRSR